MTSAVPAAVRGNKDLVVVVEARGSVGAGNEGTARRRISEWVAVWVSRRGGTEWVGVWIGRWVALGRRRCGCWWVFGVAGLGEAWDEFLDDVDFEEGGEVGDSAGADESVFERLGSGGSGGGGGGGSGVQCVWEEALGEEVARDDVEGRRLVIAETESHDHGFPAETVDFEEELQRGLCMGVAEAVGAGRGVP